MKEGGHEKTNQLLKSDWHCVWNLNHQNWLKKQVTGSELHNQEVWEKKQLACNLWLYLAISTVKIGDIASGTLVDVARCTDHSYYVAAAFYVDLATKDVSCDATVFRAGVQEKDGSGSRY